MAINASWAKWIYASVAKHFDDARETVHLFFEAQDRETKELSEYAEFRLQGPTIKELSKGVFELGCTVNILVCVATGTDNTFRIHEIGGMFQAACTVLAVKKYGNAVGDDVSQVFCLTPSPKKGDEIAWHYFGKIDPNVELLHGCVVAKYQVSFTT